MLHEYMNQSEPRGLRRQGSIDPSFGNQSVDQRAMKVVLDDGGRAAAGHGTKASKDCVCRTIAIAAGLDYQKVYDLLMEMAPDHATKGVLKPATRAFLARLGWLWHPCMFIGQGCKVHLRANELPSGRLIVSVSRHVTAVIDHVIHDTHDPSRGGSRCVYGYWTQGGN
jgi:hypothetical protein